MDSKVLIAKRVAMELKDGDLVNLGIGLPTLVADYVPANIKVMFQSENGLIGMGPVPPQGMENPDLTNAGAAPVSSVAGAMTFDTAFSFAIIRGGHLDVTVLGGLQVDEKGRLANWMVPGKMIPGMGGAMDLIAGAKRVILAMEHTAKGSHKILKKCNLPLTAAGQVDMIITEMGVMDITPDGILLREIHPEFSVEQVQEATGAKLIIPDNLIKMRL